MYTMKKSVCAPREKQTEMKRKVCSRSLSVWLIINVAESFSLCDYSHFFAVGWTHKIAVRGPVHAQIFQGKGRVFRQIGLISVQYIENGLISLQEGIDESSFKMSFSSHFCERMCQVTITTRAHLTAGLVCVGKGTLRLTLSPLESTVLQEANRWVYLMAHYSMGQKIGSWLCCTSRPTLLRSCY